METDQIAAAECRCGLARAMESDDATRRSEAEGWHEFHTLIDRLTPEEVLTPGYYPEGWTVRDLVGHVGAWLAEAAALLDQMRAGTYRRGEVDIDASNQRFLELMRGVPFATVHLQAWSAHAQLLRAWSQLPVVTPNARWWLAKAGTEHYADHLPRLQAWVDELTAPRSDARRDAR